MKNATQRIEAARAALTDGFQTKAAKKDATDQLNRAWDQVQMETLDSKQRWEADLPMYVHQITAKRIAKMPVAIQSVARQLADLVGEIKAAPVTPKAKKVDDTKVREAEVADPLKFVDSNGDERGVCWCCGRAGFKLNAKTGAMSRHGFKRPGWGYEVGGCPGSGMTPRMALEEAIRWTRKRVAQTEELLADPAELAALEIRKIRSEQKDRRASAWGRRSAADRLRRIRANGATDNFVHGLGLHLKALQGHLKRAERAYAQHLAAA